MQFSEQLIGKILVVGLRGRLDLAAEGALLAAFDSWMKNTPDFVFDCTSLDFIDSSGLGILLRTLKRAIGAGKDIRLAAINDQVRMLFEITRADKIFRIYPTSEEAVKSYAEN